MIHTSHSIRPVAIGELNGILANPCFNFRCHCFPSAIKFLGRRPQASSRNYNGGSPSSLRWFRRNRRRPAKSTETFSYNSLFILYTLLAFLSSIFHDCFPKYQNTAQQGGISNLCLIFPRPYFLFPTLRLETMNLLEYFFGVRVFCPLPVGRPQAETARRRPR